ncbi:MAG: nitroreductase/quinone reductase family protein [Actinomycetota bacterium]
MAQGSGVAPRYEKVASPEVHDRLRRAFRSMNRGMVILWRLGLGRWAEAWPSIGGRVLVVEHHGRKSGNRYLAPLNFSREGTVYLCLAAFGPKADWYRNVMAARKAVLWLPDGRWLAAFSDVTDEPDARERIRQILVDSGFAARAFGLNPQLMTDDEIDEATAPYRLVQFDPIAPLGGGYADLAWVWIPAGGAVAAGALAKLARRRYSRQQRTRFGTQPCDPS